MKTTLEFIKYTGRYPNLCSGYFYVKINGELVAFGNRYLIFNDVPSDIPVYGCFWTPGQYASAGIDDEGEEFISHDKWELASEQFIKINKYPKKIKILLPRLIKLFNKNVKEPCCGGCI